MGTQQALTTKQLEVLIVLNAIEEDIAKNNIFFERDAGFRKERNQRLNDIDWAEYGVKTPGVIFEDTDGTEESNFDCAVFELDELCALCYYGYINEKGDVTRDGKQYISLLLEDLEKKAENPSIVINNQFTLINIEQLNAGLNTFVEFAGNSITFSKVAEGVTKVIQFVKKKIIK